MTKSKGYRDLIVYQKAFALAMKVFELTKTYPKEEKYSLVDQIRRSSRSVCSCLAEAYRKRRENSETIVWLEFSLANNYVTQEEFNQLEQDAEEVGRMLNSGIESPEKFLPKEYKLEKQV